MWTYSLVGAPYSPICSAIYCLAKDMSCLYEDDILEYGNGDPYRCTLLRVVDTGAVQKFIFIASSDEKAHPHETHPI